MTGVYKGFEIAMVPKEDIAKVWPKVADHIMRPLVQTNVFDYLGISDIIEMLLKGHMQLWVVADRTGFIAAGMSQIIIYPKCRVLEITALGGKDYNLWGKDIMAAVRLFAARQDCKFVRGYGRVGWRKLLKYLNVRTYLYFDYLVKGENDET